MHGNAIGCFSISHQFVAIAGLMMGANPAKLPLRIAAVGCVVLVLADWFSLKPSYAKKKKLRSLPS